MRKHGLQINIGSATKPNWQWAVTDSELELSITDISSIFDTEYGGTVSLEFEFDCKVNKHIVGNAHLMKGARIHDALYGKRFRLYFDGVLVLSGFIWIDQEVEVENGIVPIALKSNNRDFKERLEGVKANDVPIEKMDPTIIGVCNDLANTSELHFTWEYVDVEITYGSRGGFSVKQLSSTRHSGERTIGSLGFPTLMYPTYTDASGRNFDYTNIGIPYPLAKFCNIRLCAPVSGESSSEGGSHSYTHTAQYPLHSIRNVSTRVTAKTLRYDREHSAPCFFVLYWVDMLCKALGITIVRNDMTHVLDLCRLAFFNVHCMYGTAKFEGDDSVFMVREDGRLATDRDDPGHIKPHTYKKFTDILSFRPIKGEGETKGEDILNDLIYDIEGSRHHAGESVAAKKIVKSNCEFKTKAYAAIATGKNFPETDAATVIGSLRSAFGVRTLYDSERQSLEFVFIKDILNAEEVEDLVCVVNKCDKVETHYDGVRVKYSGTGEQNRNAITGERELTGTTDKGEDTTFDYYDYTLVREFSNYGEALNSITAYNMYCYIDNVTGNAYRIKNDKTAKTSTTLYPSLFEVGTFRPVEYGICSLTERVKEITIGFAPVVPNDTNATAIQSWFRENGPEREQRTPTPTYAPFIDTEIGTRTMSVAWYEIDADSILHFTKSGTGANNPSVGIGITLWLEDAWSLSENIETPLQQEDAGFTLGIMRGSGSSGGYEIMENDYDGEGHQSWTYVAGGADQFTADSIDAFGDSYDYNGTDEGLGYGDDRPFSLKLKAEKPYKGGMKRIDELTGQEYIVTDSLLPTHEDGTPVYYPIDSRHSKRGLVDRFLLEEIYFWLHCRVATFSVTISLATLLTIDKKKRYRINGIKGWIKKVTYRLNMSLGIRDVVIELYYL